MAQMDTPYSQFFFPAPFNISKIAKPIILPTLALADQKPSRIEFYFELNLEFMIMSRLGQVYDCRNPLMLMKTAKT